MTILAVELIAAGLIANVLPLYYEYKLKRAIKRDSIVTAATITGKDLYREKQALQDKLHEIELQLMKKELAENQYF